MMKINLNLLPVCIDELVDIPEEFYACTSIKGLSKVKVSGVIKYNLSDEVEVILEASGEMILVDAVTNEDIKYPFSFKIDEILDENDENNQKYYEKSQNTLDKLEFLWENIVLEVPIRVTASAGANLKGEGWELNSKNNDDGLDPRFEKLNELFKGGE